MTSDDLAALLAASRDGLDDDDEDFSELVDADFDRVDLVAAAANGHRPLVAKGRDLVVDALAAAVDGTRPPVFAHPTRGGTMPRNVAKATDLSGQTDDRLYALAMNGSPDDRRAALAELRSRSRKGQHDLGTSSAVAKATDPTKMSVEDLRRLAVSGSGSEKQAALIELGLRALTGQADPVEPAKPAPAKDMTPVQVAAGPGAQGQQPDEAAKVAKGLLRRPGIRNGAEAAVVAKAVIEARRAAAAEGATPAGIELVRRMAAADAAAGLRRLRSPRAPQPPRAVR